MNEEQGSSFEGWCIVELLGHFRTAGYVTEEEHFGCKLGRIDVPDGDKMVSMLFSGSSIYRLTPTTEEVARAVALRNQPEPVQRWELPEPKEQPASRMTARGYLACPRCGRLLPDGYDGRLCPACEDVEESERENERENEQGSIDQIP